MPQPLAVEPARPKELVAALQLVFQYLAEEERAARVANALTLICQDELDPLGIMVVRKKSRLLGAMVSQRLPGAGGLLWPPQASEWPSGQEIEDQLVQAALSWLRQGGAKVAHVIVRPAEKTQVSSLVRSGFVHITALWYFRHSLVWRSPEADPLAVLLLLGKGLSFRPYPDCDRSLFHRTLMRTYEGTLDCPELNGVRSVEEIVEGHAHQGKHDPNLWWLVFQEEHPVGVVLLTEMPEWDALDIAYLGVIPEARGRGLGRALAAKILLEARARHVNQVTLAVDGRNLPAWNMYLALGFQPLEQREVYLYIWGQ
jgi:ribosomal protein S18 acetylase RimI-like enzyme